MGARVATVKVARKHITEVAQKQKSKELKLNKKARVKYLESKGIRKATRTDLPVILDSRVAVAQVSQFVTETLQKELDTDTIDREAISMAYEQSDRVSEQP